MLKLGFEFDFELDLELIVQMQVNIYWQFINNSTLFPSNKG